MPPLLWKRDCESMMEFAASMCHLIATREVVKDFPFGVPFATKLYQCKEEFSIRGAYKLP